MNEFKNTINDIKLSISTLTFRSVIFLLIILILIYTFLQIFMWLFINSSTSLPQSAININSEEMDNSNENDILRYHGLRIYNKPEVFNVKDNSYFFSEAENVCKKYNARLASKMDLQDSYKKGANWCNLGWLTSQDAYYPTQSQQVSLSKKWPQEFQNGCGKMGINGGFYPAKLKLSVNCYGIKPIDLVNINPWNTITKKWSQYS